jgi:hypothetical protein
MALRSAAGQDYMTQREATEQRSCHAISRDAFWSVGTLVTRDNNPSHVLVLTPSRTHLFWRRTCFAGSNRGHATDDPITRRCRYSGLHYSTHISLSERECRTFALCRIHE